MQRILDVLMDVGYLFDEKNVRNHQPSGHALPIWWLTVDQSPCKSLFRNWTLLVQKWWLLDAKIFMDLLNGNDRWCPVNWRFGSVIPPLKTIGFVLWCSAISIKLLVLTSDVTCCLCCRCEAVKYVENGGVVFLRHPANIWLWLEEVVIIIDYRKAVRMMLMSKPHKEKASYTGILYWATTRRRSGNRFWCWQPPPSGGSVQIFRQWHRGWHQDCASAVQCVTSGQKMLAILWSTDNMNHQDGRETDGRQSSICFLLVVFYCMQRFHRFHSSTQK